MKYKQSAEKLLVILLIGTVSIAICSCGGKSTVENTALQSREIVSQSVTGQTEKKEENLQKLNTTTVNKTSNENAELRNSLIAAKVDSQHEVKEVVKEQKKKSTFFVKKKDIPLQSQVDNTKESKSSYQDVELAKNAKTAMDKTVNYMCDYYLKQRSTGLVDWPAVALKSAGENLKADKWKNKINEAVAGRENEIRNEVDFDARRSTDYQKTILALVSLDRNIRSFSGKDWLKIIQNSQQKNGKFADSVDEGGDNLMNAHVWGIISLSVAGEEIPDKQKAYDWLVRHQNSDGGFGIDVASGASDIDMTGMSLTALGMLGKNEKDKCVQKALNYLGLEQLDNGGFKLWGEENPESASAVVQGLIATGQDPLSEKWNKGEGKNPISFILAFQLPDGSFKHTREGESDMTATSKSLMALGDFYYTNKTHKKYSSFLPMTGER